MSNNLKAHIAPIKRSPVQVPLDMKRSAIRLYYRTDGPTAAYVYGVHNATIYRWRDTIRL